MDAPKVSLIGGILADVRECAMAVRTDVRSCQQFDKCEWPKCPCPVLDEARESWTTFPIVYDKTIGEAGRTVRLELDSTGQGQLTFAQGGQVTVVPTWDEELHDLEHLILRGLNHTAREQRHGWAVP